MANETRARADARLQEALAAHGLEDSREAYRSRLRQLRARAGDAYRRATEYFESQVTPRLLEEADPVEAWIAYGGMIGSLASPGRLVAIDETGRATPYTGPFVDGTLVLFMSDARDEDVFAAAVPRRLSPAQRATIDLLIEKKLSL